MSGNTTPPTVRSIAQQARCELHNVHHIIEKLGIKPTGHVGITRIFSEADAARAVKALSQSKSHRPLQNV
jgi:hypothetical protein